MKIQRFGYRRDAKDQRDRIFVGDPSPLPVDFDLTKTCPPIMDQGQLGSCTAHGITGALRFLLIKKEIGDRPLSRLQLYYDERAIEGTVKSDAGAEIRDGIKSAGKVGVAHETLWPYDEKKFAKKPSAAVYKDAKLEIATSYVRVPVDAQTVRAALVQLSVPVVIGISVFQSFESDDVARTGTVPMPGPRDAPIGGHCMYVVGYYRGGFLVRNSWGTSWGNNGVCWMPDAYIGSSKLGSDYWAITA